MIIENEAQAWEVLERLNNGETVQFGDISFSGWPSLKVYVKDGDASLSMEMMESFVEYQKHLYRSVALLTRGEKDIRRLTAQDKENYSFRIKVEEGSTDAQGNLQDVAIQLAKDLVGKMTPTQTFIAVLVLVLGLTSGAILKLILNHNLEKRKLEADKNKDQRFLDQQIKLSEIDVKRQKIMQSAIATSSILSQVTEVTSDAALELLDITSTEGDTYISEVEVTELLADEIGRSTRKKSESDQFSGEYKIRKVDATHKEGFRIQLEDIKTQQVFTASLADKLVIGDLELVLEKATYQKTNITAEIKAKIVSNEIRDAQILSAKQVKKK